MKTIIGIFTILSFLPGCQKPNLAGSPIPVGSKTECVGGGCSDTARAAIETTIDQNGHIWHSSKEDLLKGEPSTNMPTSSWQAAIESFFSPGSLTNRPDTGSVPLPKDTPVPDPDDSETEVVDNGGAGSTGGPIFNPEKPTKDDTKPIVFSHSELGKAFTFIGTNVGAAWGEISGANAEKRRKAKALKKKVNEAKSIGEQIVLMVDDMNESAGAIQAAGQTIIESDRYTKTGEIRAVTNSLANDQNVRGNQLIDGTTDIGEEITVPIEKAIDNTPELASIREARAYRDSVQKKIDGMDQKGVRQTIVNYSSSALDSAEVAYRSGDNARGDLYKELAVSALDIALSLTPGVGLGKDIYEAASGLNLVSGAKLSKFERTMAVVGILTAGYGSKLALVGKAGVLIDFLKTGTKDAEAIAEVTRSVEKAEEIVVTASRASIKDKKLIDELGELAKDGLPCKVAMLSPFDRLLNLIEDVAYAADCLPGAAEDKLLGILKAPEKLGWKGSGEALDDLGSAATSVSKDAKLPSNYITKEEAKSLGWQPSKGNLHEVAPNKSVGGDRFYNDKSKLPTAEYYEADLGYRGGYRTTERMVYTKNGEKIYITNDHYDTFIQVK